MQYSETCFEDTPSFLLHTIDENLLMTGSWNDDQEWFLKMSDGEVHVLYLEEITGDKAHWLKRKDGPWVMTAEYAKLKNYDEDGRRGVMEWLVAGEHFELAFDNAQSTNEDTYL